MCVCVQVCFSHYSVMDLVESAIKGSMFQNFLTPGEPFQPSLMFAGKAGAYLSEEPFMYFNSRIGTWAVPINIRFSWKGLSVLKDFIN
jgi:hypothetical protein